MNTAATTIATFVTAIRNTMPTGLWGSKLRRSTRLDVPEQQRCTATAWRAVRTLGQHPSPGLPACQRLAGRP